MRIGLTPGGRRTRETAPMDELASPSPPGPAASRRAFLASGARIVAASGLAALAPPSRGEPPQGPVALELRAGRFRAAPDGRPREVWGNNGGLPGPMIRAKEGDLLR